jgi:DNA-binding FadR family transcriptional regulator
VGEARRGHGINAGKMSRGKALPSEKPIPSEIQVPRTSLETDPFSR